MRKIRVLVAYYSQTGQLEQIIKTVSEPLEQKPEITVDYYAIKPAKPYPFPWSSKAFFDEFPESVREIPVDLETKQLSDDYDLVILGYQPWFLSVSRPMSSFLQKNEIQRMLKGKRVVTIIGCRNMWTQAQEMLKKRLQEIGAQLTGNIVLRDRAWNLTSVYTILRWMFYGKKGNSGISEQDISHSKFFGEYIADQLVSGNNIEQKTLVTLGGIEPISSLIFMEKRAIILFRLFADFILKATNAEKRQRRLMIFKIYLFIGILLLSPIAFIVAKIRALLAPQNSKAEKDYFEGISF